jgi:maltose alpha-D-glucosyltransferase/alpha-amylase
LVKNLFPNAPKIYGTIKILEKETIGILENVTNMGNLGDIYWNELNEMVNSVFPNPSKNYSHLNNKEEFSKLIKKYCPESISVSMNIGDDIKRLHKALILQGSKEYESEKVEREVYLKKYTEKLENMLIHLEKIMKKETEVVYYNLPKISSILIDIKDTIENLRTKYQEAYIEIQPVHQDLHMEQILYNKVNGHYTFYFIDFEGDPQLSLEEKKNKFPTEKDLAAFLRALSYIKFNTLLLYIEKKIIRKDKYEVPEEILYNLFFRKISSPEYELLNIVLNLLNAWEYKMLYKFLKSLAPHYTLINYFYIERTLHEITYEVLFRPNKIIIPVLGLKEIVERI